MVEEDCGSERSAGDVPNETRPARTGSSHDLRQSTVIKREIARAEPIAPVNQSDRLRTLFARFKSRKQEMPEPPQCALLLVTPGKVAILTIKFFRNNFHRAKNANERRGNEFTGHLRIFDVRR